MPLMQPWGWRSCKKEEVRTCTWLVGILTTVAMQSLQHFLRLCQAMGHIDPLAALLALCARLC